MTIITRNALTASQVPTAVEWNANWDNFVTDYNGSINASNIVNGGIQGRSVNFNDTSKFASPISFGPTQNVCVKMESQIMDAGLTFTFTNGIFKRLTDVPDFTLLGISNGLNGRICFLRNATGNDMYISNESLVASATNRIINGLGATSASTGANIYIYSPTDSRWILLVAKYIV